MRYVLNCSVAVRWLVPQTDSEHAVRVLEQFRVGHLALVAPDAIIPELGHVMRKLVVGKKVDEGRATVFFDRFLSLPIALEPAGLVASDALVLALRYTSTFYDSLYVALARREGVSVLTADQGMVRAFAPLDCVVPLSSFA